MQTLTEDSPTRLVFRVRSPLQHAVGGLGLCFLAWLAVHWYTGHPNRDRFIGLIGATVTCLLFALVSETGDFVFDASARRLTWRRRFGLRRRSGSLPFEAIEQVVVRTAIGSTATVPSRRVVLLTRDGELPLTASFGPGGDEEAQAERLRAFLGRDPDEALSASLADLVARGQDVHAIRELRLARGLSLTEAHDEVAKLRQSIRKN